MNLGRLMGVVFFGMLLLTASADAALGVVVNGVGTGTAVATNGSYDCDGATFKVHAVYLPGRRGVVEFLWMGQIPDCIHNGGSAVTGTISYDLAAMPPLTYQSDCVGDEASGLDCGFLRVGPYQGIGSNVWLSKATSVEMFYGIFLAV